MTQRLVPKSQKNSPCVWQKMGWWGGGSEAANLTSQLFEDIFLVDWGVGLKKGVKRVQGFKGIGPFLRISTENQGWKMGCGWVRVTSGTFGYKDTEIYQVSLITINVVWSSYDDGYSSWNPHTL